MHIGIMLALRTFGIDPDDIEWIEDSNVAYGAGGADGLLRSGAISLIQASGARAEQLLREGFPLVLDLADFYLQRGAWPPGRVVVATRKTIDKRGEDLRAFLRANLRGYWFSIDAANHAYMHDLETRCRESTFNEDERKVRRLRDPGAEPEDADPRLFGGSMALDGQVDRAALASIIEDMVSAGYLDHPIDVNDVLQQDAAIDACQNLLDRGLIDPRKLAEWRRAKGIRP
jgi:hypothetical protein